MFWSVPHSIEIQTKTFSPVCTFFVDKNGVKKQRTLSYRKRRERIVFYRSSLLRVYAGASLSRKSPLQAVFKEKGLP